MANVDSILKIRDIHLLTKGYIVKTMVYPVVMYGCDSWTIRKLSAKELMLLICERVPWTAKISNQSILKEINPEYLLKGLILKLELQYFGHLYEEPTHWKRP